MAENHDIIIRVTLSQVDALTQLGNFLLDDIMDPATSIYDPTTHTTVPSETSEELRVMSERGGGKQSLRDPLSESG